MLRDELWESRRKQLEEWRSSGLTQRAYCERAGIAFGVFRYWRRKLDRADDEGGSVPGFVAVGVASSSKARVGGVAGKRTQALAQPLEVVLSSGRRLRFEDVLDEAGLTRLIRLLEAVAC